ncbi:N-acetyltransferase [Staphylococcus succinus]|uniref:N-acetyltransferase n=1 Tax=Staphylococcus succinus TaxID=61015 RepID=A0A9Q6HRD6_9STAP|nr:MULTISPECIES: GNAT family N-acetyltransferase [Staphylococcus]MBU0438412.1 GNAT family N-acetyltransferase [Staphylococcus succinus]MDH9161953.1 GNAT family N-acetyltransferase [Staphylococcus succinus]MEB7462655.1 GNAT family N-acetyltransferase [Staphylococcus succinus]MEB8123506.1 GNAT family N-acetyltransferase [Staphylococcus succinus]MEB8127280.1 GNAT family N-acetyltransferase [Staphylococcus succinus]
MIRHATKTDLPNILDIYNDAILNTTAVYTYNPQTIEAREEWFEKKANNHEPVLVYEEQGEAIAFATYGSFRDWPAYQYSIEHSIYVNKHHRGKGIASLLLAEIIQTARDHGYKTLVAGIDATNDYSIYLHKKFKFTHSGTIHNVGYKFNKWLDLAFYQLDLSNNE